MASSFEEKFKSFIEEETVSREEAVKSEEKESYFVEAKAADDSISDTISTVFGVDVPSFRTDLAVQTFSETDWHEDVRKFIPEVDSNYVWNLPTNVKDLLDLQLAIQQGDNIFMFGDKAAGKSSFLEQYCAIVKRPFIRQNGSGDMETSSVFGGYTVDPEHGTVWNDGLCTIAAKHGAVFLQDEGSAISPEIIMGYQWMLESGGKLMLSDKQGTPDEKIVVPDNRFVFAVADNTNGSGDTTGNYAGTNVWNSATLDRFGTFIHRTYMDAQSEIRVLTRIVPDLTDALASKMVQFANLVRTSHAQGEIGITMSLRGLESWGKKAVFHRDPRESLKVAFFNRLSGDDEKEAVSAMYMTTFDEAL